MCGMFDTLPRNHFVLDLHLTVQDALPSTPSLPHQPKRIVDCQSLRKVSIIPTRKKRSWTKTLLVLHTQMNDQHLSKILLSLQRDVQSNQSLTNLNIRLNQRARAQIPQRPKMDPTKRHTTYLLYLALSHSGIPITDGKVSVVVIWLSWMRRLSRWVDMIEPCEWVETMMASASWRSDIHPSFGMRLLYNLSKEGYLNVTTQSWAYLSALLSIVPSPSKGNLVIFSNSPT